MSAAPNQALRSWVDLAVGCLALGGVLSVVLILGRAPGTRHLVGDPLFVQRVLVIHVNLALTCWFLGFAAALFQLARTRPRFGFPGWLCLAGMATLLGSGLVPSATPVLSNYVPVLEHPLHGAGLGLFLLGVLATFVAGGWREGPPGKDSAGSAAVRLGARATALLTIAAAVTLALTLVRSRFDSSSAHGYFETLFWGAGHLFQYASAAMLMTAWLYLLERAYGIGVLPLGWVRALFAVAVLPIIPGLYLASGGGDYFHGFELTMRWMSWQAPTALILFSLWLFRSRRPSLLAPSHHALFKSGMTVSMVLLATGFLLGSMIRGSTTLIPAHYHAALGAVTTGLMTLTYFLFEPLGMRWPEGGPGKWVVRQPLLSGVGQMVFVGGFSLAGFYGSARKAYGSEQLIRTTQESVGLGIAGIGGLVAVVAGGLFLWTFHRARKAGAEVHARGAMPAAAPPPVDFG